MKRYGQRYDLRAATDKSSAAGCRYRYRRSAVDCVTDKMRNTSRFRAGRIMAYRNVWRNLEIWFEIVENIFEAEGKFESKGVQVCAEICSEICDNKHRR